MTSLHRHDGAEHVRHVGDRDHLRARRKQLLEFLDEEAAVVGDRRPLDHRALALADGSATARCWSGAP